MGAEYNLCPARRCCLRSVTNEFQWLECCPCRQLAAGQLTRFWNRPTVCHHGDLLQNFCSQTAQIERCSQLSSTSADLTVVELGRNSAIYSASLYLLHPASHVLLVLYRNALGTDSFPRTSLKPVHSNL